MRTETTSEYMRRRFAEIDAAKPKPAPAPPKPRVLSAGEVAEQGRQIAALKADIEALEARPAPVAVTAVPDIPHPSDYVGAHTDSPVHRAAIAAMERDSTLTYYAAVAKVTARRTA